MVSSSNRGNGLGVRPLGLGGWGLAVVFTVAALGLAGCDRTAGVTPGPQLPASNATPDGAFVSVPMDGARPGTVAATPVDGTVCPSTRSVFLKLYDQALGKAAPTTDKPADPAALLPDTDLSPDTPTDAAAPPLPKSFQAVSDTACDLPRSWTPSEMNAHVARMNQDATGPKPTRVGLFCMARWWETGVFEGGRNLMRAVPLYQQAGALGSKKAKNNLAILYATATPRRHSNEAIDRLFAEAAQMGLPEATRNAAFWLASRGEEARARDLLATLGSSGAGTAMAGAVATRATRTVGPELWLRRAEAGSREDQYRAAMMYLLGRGVPRSIDQAQQLLERAARKNHPAAQYELGVLHLQAARTLDAYVWVNIAAAQQDQPTWQACRDSLEATLRTRPDDLRKAQNQAQEIWNALRQGREPQTLAVSP